MADLGLYFGDGDEDEEQLEQEDKALSYLVLANDQDDAFDPIDTDNLLAQMTAEAMMPHGIELDEDTDVVWLLGEPDLSAVEKAQVLAKSQYDFHRSFLARELSTLLPQMKAQEAITHILPIIRSFSVDRVDSVRESLVAQLDKVVLYFFQNTVIDFSPQEPRDQEQSDNKSLEPPLLPHDTFTPTFMNLLLDQNAGIAHQARLVVVAIAEATSSEIMESEVLNGIIAGLTKLYTPEDGEDISKGGDSTLTNSHNPFVPHKDEQDNEAELGKMIVVLLLKSLAEILGPDRCTQIVIPTLEKFMSNSQFYVRKEVIVALGTLCKVVDQAVVVDQLLPLFEIFVHDDTWHIRRACCTVLAPFISSLPLEMRTSRVEEIYELYSVDTSRSVRNSIMEVLGEVIAGFEKEQVPDSLLNHFLDMGSQPTSEHEQAVLCAFSFPAVILTAGRSKWERMKPVYMRLAAAFRSPIRRSLACSLHEVARILGPELADRDLAPAFTECLLAEDEVKEGVLGHVVEFMSCLSPKCRSDVLNDLSRAWVGLEQSSNWRLRDSLAGQLPALCEIAEGEDLLKVLMPLSVKACTDGVSAIRESGVMSYPAFWEASARVGAVPVLNPPKEIVLAPEMDLNEAEVASRDDVEMEDATMHFKDDLEIESSTPLRQDARPTGLCADDGDVEMKDAALVPKGDPVPSQEEWTTIKEQVIRQTVDFAVNGGFRSRIVAVQIIQSLLDYGISTQDFEEHFLPLLVDRLATDSVVSIRIWVARVVSWIIESGYYKDEPVSERIQDLLTRLQQDLDRDVRISSGGPAELPKPKRKKKKSSKGKKKKKETLFHQNPKNGVATIQEENDDEDDKAQLIFGGEEDSDEEDDGDEDDDEDDSSDDGADFLNSAKASGISNKPRNRNSIGIGMKVMVGNKLTVGGKEIRKPKTSWDYVHGEVEEEDDTETTVLDFSSLGRSENRESEHGLLGLEQTEEPGSFDSPRHMFAEDDDSGEDATLADHDISKVIPYTTKDANGASPLAVEMEESYQNDDDQYYLPDAPFSFAQGLSFAQGHSSHSADDAEESVVPVTSQRPTLSQEPAMLAAFPPLSPTSSASQSLPTLSSTTRSYAASVTDGEDLKTKALAPVSDSLSSMTSFSQSNIPEPRPTAVTVDAAAGHESLANERSPEEDVLRILNAKLLASGSGKKIGQGNELHSTQSSDVSTSLASEATHEKDSTPSSLLVPNHAAPSIVLPPISYASVVASGSPASPRPIHSAFSPPLSPSIPTAPTFSF